MLFARGTWVFN